MPEAGAQRSACPPDREAWQALTRCTRVGGEPQREMPWTALVARLERRAQSRSVGACVAAWRRRGKGPSAAPGGPYPARRPSLFARRVWRGAGSATATSAAVCRGRVPGKREGSDMPCWGAWGLGRTRGPDRMMRPMSIVARPDTLNLSWSSRAACTALARRRFRLSNLCRQDFERPLRCGERDPFEGLGVASPVCRGGAALVLAVSSLTRGAP
jgi:hypothetical protein